MEQKRKQAPVFIWKYLLSKAISELVGSGFNLFVYLAVEYRSFDQLQCGHQVFHAANFKCHSDLDKRTTNIVECWSEQNFFRAE